MQIENVRCVNSFSDDNFLFQIIGIATLIFVLVTDVKMKTIVIDTLPSDVGTPTHSSATTKLSRQFLSITCPFFFYSKNYPGH